MLDILNKLFCFGLFRRPPVITPVSEDTIREARNAFFSERANRNNLFYRVETKTERSFYYTRKRETSYASDPDIEIISERKRNIKKEIDEHFEDLEFRINN